MSRLTPETWSDEALLADRLVIRMIDPNRLLLPNETHDPAKLERIEESMREAGWCGRPILVDPHFSRVNLDHEAVYQAYTGAHRIMAARAVGIHRVPCVMVDWTGEVETNDPVE